MRPLVQLGILGALILAGHTVRADPPQTGATDACVALVLVDGLRWQEVFTGAEEALLSKDPGGVKDETRCRMEFWRESPEERRAVLMPFLWSVVAREGQLYGNKNKGCIATVSNGKKFSYPGYSEMIVGFPDDRIDSNDKIPNPNVSVLEWLHSRPGFQGRVAAFAAWDVVPFILNEPRCGFYINAARDPVVVGNLSAEQRLLNQLKQDVPSPWGAEPYDAITFYSAMEYVKEHKPRVLYLTFGETDEWAHSGRYDEYLAAARRTDQFLATLWGSFQSMPEYAGRTTLMVAADHGRGHGPTEWKNHKRETDGAEFIWLAVIGPRTPALGEVVNHNVVVQAQVAATLAAAVGEDFCASEPRAAKPVEGAVRPIAK